GSSLLVTRSPLVASPLPSRSTLFPYTTLFRSTCGAFGVFALRTLLCSLLFACGTRLPSTGGRLLRRVIRLLFSHSLLPVLPIGVWIWLRLQCHCLLRVDVIIR